MHGVPGGDMFNRVIHYDGRRRYILKEQRVTVDWDNPPMTCILCVTARSLGVQ